MAERKRPLSVGLFFSLGHSTIVFLLALLFAAGFRLSPARSGSSSSSLDSVTSLVGTGISGGFLYLIAALNVVILFGILRMLRQHAARRLRRSGARATAQQPRADEPLLGRFTKARVGAWQMYPIGLLFGLGFDTATEVALLFLAAGAAGAGLPFYAIHLPPGPVRCRDVACWTRSTARS